MFHSLECFPFTFHAKFLCSILGPENRSCHLNTAYRVDSNIGFLHSYPKCVVNTWFRYSLTYFRCFISDSLTFISGLHTWRLSCRLLIGRSSPHPFVWSNTYWFATSPYWPMTRGLPPSLIQLRAIHTSLPSEGLFRSHSTPPLYVRVSYTAVR